MTKTTSASSSAPSSPTQVQLGGSAHHQTFANLAAIARNAGLGSVTATPMDVAQRPRLEPGMLMHAPNASWPGLGAPGFDDASVPIRPTATHSLSFGMSSFTLESPTTPTFAQNAPSALMKQQLSLPGDVAGQSVSPPAGPPQPTARPQVSSRQRSASQPQGRNRALSASDDGKKRMQSCDICRIRKVKCVRPDDAASLATGKCKQCLANHAKCTYAYVPKKPGPQTASAKALARREDKERQVHASAAAAVLTKGTSSSSSSAGSSTYQARTMALASKRRGSEQHTTSSGGDQSSTSSRKSSFIEYVPTDTQQTPHIHLPPHHFTSWDYFPDQYGAQPASAPPHITSMQFHHHAAAAGGVGGGSAHLPHAMQPQWAAHAPFDHDVLTPMHGANPLESALAPGLELMSSQQHGGSYANAMSMMPSGGGAGGHDAAPAGLPMANHPQHFSPPYQPHPHHVTSPFQAPLHSPFITAPATADLGDATTAYGGVQRAACFHASPQHSSDSRPSSMSMLYNPSASSGGGGGEQQDAGSDAYTGLSAAGTPSSYLGGAHAATSHWRASMVMHDPSSALSAEHLPHRRDSSANDVGPPPPTGNSEDQWNDMWHFTAPPPS